jgi:hypothetical protein
VDRHVVHTDFYPNTDMHSDRLIIIAVQYTWSSLVLGEQVVLGTLITRSNSLKLIYIIVIFIVFDYSSYLKY